MWDLNELTNKKRTIIYTLLEMPN